jgi:hypothetical protein
VGPESGVAPASETAPASLVVQYLIAETSGKVMHTCPAEHSAAVVQSWTGPTVGMLGQGPTWQAVVIAALPQQTMPVPHVDVVRHCVAAGAESEPPPLLLPPLSSLAVASSGVPESVAGVTGALLLLELQATAKEIAAQPETAHKIIAFFILKTSLLSLGETHAARVWGRWAVSYSSPLSA